LCSVTDTIAECFTEIFFRSFSIPLLLSVEEMGFLWKACEWTDEDGVLGRVGWGGIDGLWQQVIFLLPEE